MPSRQLLGIGRTNMTDTIPTPPFGEEIIGTEFDLTQNFDLEQILAAQKGTTGDDHLVGTNSDDEIRGRLGNDVLPR